MIMVSDSGRASMVRLVVMRMLILGALAAACMVWWPADAWARVGARFAISSAADTTAAENATLQYWLDVRNVGDEPTDGGRLTLVGTFPAGVTPAFAFGGVWDCAVAGQTITCTNSGVLEPQVGDAFFTPIVMFASVDPGTTGVRTATFDVSGGGATSAMTVDPTTFTSTLPGFGIDAFDGQVNADAIGTPLTQAGGHPYDATTTIDFNTIESPDPQVGQLLPAEAAKNIVVDLPPGLIGNPQATAGFKCTTGELANTAGPAELPLCPPGSQVGTATIVATTRGAMGPFAVYNMVAPPDVPARLGFNAAGTVVTLNASLRSGSDYGATVSVRNAPEGLAIAKTTLTIWGVPADESHDPQRTCPGRLEPWVGGSSCGTDAPLKAFWRNPTSCSAPPGSRVGDGLVTTLHVDSWVHPGAFTADGVPDLSDPSWKSSEFVSHDLPGYPSRPDGWGSHLLPDSCGKVPFSPALRGEPAGPAKAGQPLGFTFDLTLPQSDDPSRIAQSDLRKAVVTLPEGVRVSPGSAAGLQACSSAQIALRSDRDPTCPEASKLGSVVIDTPLLEEQVTGSIYLATPFDNPFGSLVAIYLVARGPGVILKLPGHTTMDSSTGQITTTFDDNPQLPFSRLHLEFKGGPRAPLALPKRCGTYTTHAVMTGWSGAVATSDSSFTLTENARGQPCPSTFTPEFSAGTASNSAGKASAFLLRLARDDEDQELRSLTVSLPSGLTGKIANVDLCSDGDARNGSCGAGSRIGDVVTGAGPGTNPFFITNGSAYLTGPYKGAPLGLSIVVPAVAGPFDLGKVSVLSALFVDKHTAAVRVVSDAFPTILEGIPLDVRDVRVNVNHPDFFINPTSCAEKRIGGVLESTQGVSAQVSDRFQAAGCASLAVKPKMTIQVGGRGRTGKGTSTPLTATLRQTPGQANLKSVRVTLPTTINARLTVINEACTRAQFEARNCEKARTGTANVVTPLLKDPLRGNVYFVKNGNPLPDMFVALRGQVSVDLIGKITIPGSKRLRTTFDLVPDVPFDSFTLKLVSGRDGSVGTAANLCSARARRAKAELDFAGQNGKVLHVNQRLKVRGCSGGHRTARARRTSQSQSGRRR